MAYVDGKVSFPEKSGIQPEIGEIWEVSVAGQNLKRTVNFLEMIQKVELKEWSWDNQRGSRGRMPACLVISPEGNIYRFIGRDIDGVAKIVGSKYTKQGKWSHTVFDCISPEGTKIYSWRQSWGEGVFWPQSSWEEAIATVQAVAPQAKPEAIEEVIREHWPKAAEKFDENRLVLQTFASFGSEIKKWSWNDGIASRSRRPACLVISSEGDIHRFSGEHIPGVAQILSDEYEQNGKWSNTTYHCVSPAGTEIYFWRQSWDEGLFWPQSSWEEAIATLQEVAPQAKPEAIEEIIREHWPKAAEKFDENRRIMEEMSGDGSGKPPEKVEISFGSPTNRAIRDGFWERPKSIPGYKAEIRLINPDEGWSKDNIDVVGISGKVLSVSHSSGMHGGYYSVLVVVTPGTETEIPLFQTAREKAAKKSSLPESLFHAFDGDEDRVRKFMTKVKKLDAKKLDAHEMSCGRARVSAEVLRISGDQDFFLGADPLKVIGYIKEVHINFGGDASEAKSLVATIGEADGFNTPFATLVALRK